MAEVSLEFCLGIKPVGKGNGMGLDLVRKIVGEMDGSISVESEVSKGTNFRIVFPLYQ